MTFRWTVKWSTWCQSFPGTEKPFWTLWKRLDAALSLTKPPTLEDLEQRLLHLFRWNCMQLSWMSINITWPSLNWEFCYQTFALTLSGVNVVMCPRLWGWHLLVTSLVIALHLISIYGMAITFLKRKPFSYSPHKFTNLLWIKNPEKIILIKVFDATSHNL